MSRVAYLLAAALAAALLAVSLSAPAAPATRGGAAVALPGLQVGPAPWPAELNHLRARLQALGLPALPAEAFVLHIHQHLDVLVNGRRVTVPAGIGINYVEQFISPLHTHDTSGIIHVESPDVRPFTLGQFFGVWGVRFTPSCLGGYCVKGAQKLRVFVNGRPVSSDPTRLRLAAHQVIVVAFGTAKQLPRPIPSRYPFDQLGL